MELLHLRYFCKIAERQSLTKAAKDLYISQPSLSRILKSLEDELGIKLFERVNRQVQITEKGSIFLDQIEKALAIIDNAKLSMNPGAGEQKEIVIALTFTSELVTRIFKLFHELFPDIKLTIMIPSEVVNLMPRNFDICISVAPVSHNGLVHEPLYREEIVLLMSNRHRFANADKIRLADLSEDRFVMPPPGPMRTVCDMLCSYAGFVPNVAASTHSYLSIQTYINTGECVALRTTSGASSVIGNDIIAVHISSPNPYQQIFLTRPSNKTLSPAAEAFSDFMHEYIKTAAKLGKITV